MHLALVTLSMLVILLVPGLAAQQNYAEPVTKYEFDALSWLCAGYQPVQKDGPPRPSVEKSIQSRHAFPAVAPAFMAESLPARTVQESVIRSGTPHGQVHANQAGRQWACGRLERDT